MNMEDRPIRTANIYHPGRAEVRVYDKDPGSDEASDMYVFDVFGVTVIVRKVFRKNEDDAGNVTTQEIRRVTVEWDGYPFETNINETEFEWTARNYYTETDW